MLARLLSNGRVVIPKAVREALGLQPGTQFLVRLQDGKIVLEPILDSPIDALYGKYADVNLLGDLEAEHRQEIGQDAVAGG